MSDLAPEVASQAARLADPDPAIRRIALIEVADLAFEHPAVFVAASRDEDAGVRLEAARALEGVADPAAVDALADLLADSDTEVAAAAALSLSELLDSAAGPVLLRRLETAMGGTRAPLLAALRKLKLAAALAPALTCLDDPFAAVRREAVGVLGYLKAPATVPALAALAQTDPDASVRRAGVAALCFAEDRAILPALVQALSDTDWQVREETAATLGRLAWPQAAEGLIAALADTSWEVCLKAANALGKLRDPAAIVPLAEALHHRVANLRKEAASALGAIGDVAATDALRIALNDPDVDVAKTARRALENLTGRQ